MNASIRSITGATPPAITAPATQAPPLLRAPALDRASLVADAQRLGMSPEQAHRAVVELLLGLADTARQERERAARDPVFRDAVSARWLMTVAALGQRPDLGALLPQGDVDAARLDEPGYRAQLAAATAGVEVGAVAAVLGELLGRPLSGFEALQQWQTLRAARLEEAAAAEQERAVAEATVDAAIGLAATAAGGGLLLAGARHLLTREVLGQAASRGAAVVAQQATHTLGRLGLGASAWFAGSAAHDAVRGRYAEAFNDLALSVSFLGGGAAAFGRAIPAQAAALLGRTPSAAVSQRFAQGFTAVVTANAASRITEQATGTHPLRELSAWTHERLPGTHASQRALNMLEIGLTLGSIAQPARSALWAGAFIASNASRGKFSGAAGVMGGEFGVLKGRVLPQAGSGAQAGELLRKAYLSGLVANKTLPPALRTLAEQASGGALRHFRQQQELAPAAACLAQPAPQHELVNCLTRTGLFTGD